MTNGSERPFRLVALSGNFRRPSRSRSLAGLIARRIQQQVPVTVEHYDLLDAGPGLGAAFEREQLTPEALALVEAIEAADVLVVATPVYKGSYPGLFKHLIDFLDPNALVGKPVVLAATGGGQRHALIVEHQLRPLFGFFSALTVPTAVYAEEQSFEDGEPADPGIIARIELAAGQAAALLGRGLHQRPISAAAEPRSARILSIKN